MKGSLKGGGVDVAIKVLKNGMGEKEKLRFLQEGAVNGQFHHPNVVKLYGMVTIGEPVSISTSRSPCKDRLAYYCICLIPQGLPRILFVVGRCLFI